jgi:hypothetical protein
MIYLAMVLGWALESAADGTQSSFYGVGSVLRVWATFELGLVQPDALLHRR